MSRTSPKLTAPSTTATTPTAAMLGGPLLCTREPTHSAKSGPPVQMLIVVRLIAQTSAMRSMRTRRPVGGFGSSVAFTYVIVFRYTTVYGGQGPTADTRRAPGADPRGAARRRRAGVRARRVPGRERGGDRHGGRLHARSLLLELQVQGGAVRRANPGAHRRALPRDRGRGGRGSGRTSDSAGAGGTPGRDAAPSR